MDNRQVFQDFQKTILRLANNTFFRKELWVEPTLKDKKLLGILPNAVVYEKNGLLAIDFTCSDIYAKRLFEILPEAYEFIKFQKGLLPNQRFQDFLPAVTHFLSYNSDGSGNGDVSNATAGSGSWETNRGTGTGNNGTETNQIRCLASWSSGASDYFINRGFIPFNTNGTPVPLSGSLTMFCSTVGTNNGFNNAYVTKTTQAAGNALATSDFGNIGAVSQTSSQIDGSTASHSSSANLNATGLSNINTSGYTKFGLIAQNDINDVQPPTDSSKNADFTFNSSSSVSNKPTLTLVVPSSGALFFAQL